MVWGGARVVMARIVVGVLVFAPLPVEAATRIFTGSLDHVWAVTRSVLESEGWDIDEENRATGSLVTESRGVNYRNYGLYAEGTRHRLKLTVRPAGPGRTAVSVQRELFAEERILWSTDRLPLRSDPSRVEVGILDTLGRLLPTPVPVASPPPTPPAAPPLIKRAPPAEPPPAERVSRITYRVTGNGSAVQLTYRNAQGANDRQVASSLPWELSFDGKGGAPLYVSAVAQNPANASVTCEILVDGVPRSQSMSVGASVVATCRTAAP